MTTFVSPIFLDSTGCVVGPGGLGVNHTAFEIGILVEGFLETQP